MGQFDFRIGAPATGTINPSRLAADRRAGLFCGFGSVAQIHGLAPPCIFFSIPGITERLVRSTLMSSHNSWETSDDNGPHRGSRTRQPAQGAGMHDLGWGLHPMNFHPQITGTIVAEAATGSVAEQ